MFVLLTCDERVIGNTLIYMHIYIVHVRVYVYSCVHVYIHVHVHTCTSLHAVTSYRSC